MTKHKYSVTEH